MSVVEEFHRAFGHTSPPGPTRPDHGLVRLRMRLIREEYEEVMADLKRLLARDLSYDESVDILRDLLKELADLRYVLEGCAVAFGLDIDAAFIEVHRSNMSKLGADGRPILREDGKVLKGPQYREPDIESLVPKSIEGGVV